MRRSRDWESDGTRTRFVGFEKVSRDEMFVSPHASSFAESARKRASGAGTHLAASLISTSSSSTLRFSLASVDSTNDPTRLTSSSKASKNADSLGRGLSPFSPLFPGIVSMNENESLTRSFGGVVLTCACTPGLVSGDAFLVASSSLSARTSFSKILNSP